MYLTIRLPVLISSILLANARIGFKKDQSIDSIEFPPRLGKAPDGIPQGHLRPLGYQRRPDSKIKELNEVPFPEEFHKQHVSKGSPLVIRGAVNDVPAMINWEKDEYLKKKYGDLDVHVVVKKELFTTGPKKLKFKKFLKEYQYEDWYLSNIVPKEMMSELILPNCLKCGIQHHLMESEIWMSAGGTSSLLHSHADHNLHCLLAGRKDFILINPKHKEKLDWVESPAGGGYSKLDVERINMFKFKGVAQTPWTWATLKPGDCMFVPAGYLHQVRSFGRSFSSTILWSPIEDAHFHDCDLEEVRTPLVLSEVDFLWTYKDGDRQLSDTNLDSRSTRHLLLILTRNETELRKPVFVDFYEEVMSELDKELFEGSDSIWQILDIEGKGSISKEDIQKLEEPILSSLAKALNLPNILKAKSKDEL